ncbi:ankyrin repeat domain-containing protein [Candidatus Babeliales bacterium]|nr:ankyrin repeat domain-containing protein [Candidatus Babeliales bacterium]
MKKIMVKSILTILFISSSYCAEQAPKDAQSATHDNDQIRADTAKIIIEVIKAAKSRDKYVFKQKIEALKLLHPAPLDFTKTLAPFINKIMFSDNMTETLQDFYLKTLLENGFDINCEIKTVTDPTIYHLGNIILSCPFKAHTYLEVLTKYSMNPNAQITTYDATTHLPVLIRPALWIVLDFLEDKGNDRKTIAEIIDLSLKQGADPLTPGILFDKDGKEIHSDSPLYQAIAEKANSEIITIILNHKKDDAALQEIKLYAVQVANKGTRNEESTTALYASISHGIPRITKLLLDYGADPEKGVKGKSNGISLHPLTFATEQGNLEIVKLLVEHGANINVNTNNGKIITTPKLAAFYHERKTILKYFDDYQKQQEALKSAPQKPLTDKDLFTLFKDFKAQYEDPQSKEKKGKKTLNKKQAKQQADLKKEAKKIAAQRIKNIQEEREQEKEIIISADTKNKKKSALKQGPIAFKQRVIDWFKNPERAFHIQGYVETSPRPDPFKRALYLVEGPSNIIKYHRFPRAIDTSILYDDAYGEVKKQDGDTFIITVPGHIVEDDKTITFGQFEYAFYEKENKTRIILHRFFRKLTPDELEGTFKAEDGWSDIKNVASLPERDDSQGGAAAAAGPAEDDNWQSEFEKEGWTYQDDEQTQSRIFMHPEKKEQYGIKRRSL